ncbi:hypothetical protein [Rhodococcus sp. AH-ZY2]|uniref:hypothetical protein n=1 Tax=Rhodococcus sp. AH-ZY2 TaxID=3047468 RepID=UPI0027DEBFC0|nr:hypothetical protein [Rhodococcus sp. AH-ZY2]WML63614.1 hypothetical protein QNA09_02010 [Rhodococcus sp. AH-ZY2]
MSKLSDLLNSQPVSARQAADIAKERGIALPYGTLAGYWAGTHGRPTARSLERLAEVLTIPLAQLQMAAWDTTAPLGRYTPPPEANLLGERQRRALDELIKAMAEGARHGTSTEEVPEPRTQEGGPEHRSKAGADRGRPGAPIVDDKVRHLNPVDQGEELDDDQELAARAGETQELRRRRTEGEPWDHPDPDGPEDGA